MSPIGVLGRKEIKTLYTICNHFKCGERTNSDEYYVVKHRISFDGSSQLERGFRTALNLPHWKCSVSLLILPPQIFSFQKSFPWPTDSRHILIWTVTLNPNRKEIFMSYYNIHIKRYISQVFSRFNCNSM